MFDIGFWEILLIFVVALIVVGPERLPGLARTAGLWVGKARRIVAEMKSEVERELQMDELKRSIQQQIPWMSLNNWRIGLNRSMRTYPKWAWIFSLPNQFLKRPLRQFLPHRLSPILPPPILR